MIRFPRISRGGKILPIKPKLNNENKKYLENLSQVKMDLDFILLKKILKNLFKTLLLVY